jgi:hypothetical protein
VIFAAIGGQPAQASGTLSLATAFIVSMGRCFVEAGMGQFEMIDLVSVVDACTSDRVAGHCVSMAKAVEELRVLTGDFVSPDEAVANALSAVALGRGCAVVFDEQPGADILLMP